MPLGIGRYSEHVKISTECSDDLDQAEDENAPCSVRFIGQQNIPLFNSRDISGMMYQIYNKNYSPINSLINLKKYELVVDAFGINVYLPSSKKGMARNLFMHYLLTEILLVTTDFQHDRLFAIIYYGPLRNCVLHLYLCNSEDDVKNIMNKCGEDFASNKEIKKIEKSSYSEGLEIIHYKPYEKASEIQQEAEESLREILQRNNEKKSDENCSSMKTVHPPPSTNTTPIHPPPSKIACDFKIPYNNSERANTFADEDVKDNGDIFSFGEFQMVSTINRTMTTTTTTTDLVNPMPYSPRDQNTPPRDKEPLPQTCLGVKVNLMDDDEFEDEFAELALKRNVYIPRHMQDVNIESRLLFPENLSQPANEASTKPGLFSTYNKLQF